MKGKVYQINSKLKTPGQRGLPKTAIEFAYITRNGIRGDFNRHRHEKKDDDLDQALLIYMLETIEQLNGEGFPVEPGHLGENITTKGIPHVCYAIGNQYRIGEDVLIQISKPCTPCKNLAALSYVGQERVAEFVETTVGRRGWYARVLQEGWIRTGDTIEKLVNSY